MIKPFRINRTNGFLGRMSPKPDAIVLDADGSEYNWNVINYPLKGYKPPALAGGCLVKLLTYEEIQRLFPHCETIKEHFLFMTKEILQLELLVTNNAVYVLNKGKE